MSRLLFVTTLFVSFTAIGFTGTLQAGQRDFKFRRHDQYGERTYRPLTSANPYRRYRYGNPPAASGNFYRDRQGFFFYGLDDRYRFGIHR